MQLKTFLNSNQRFAMRRAVSGELRHGLEREWITHARKRHSSGNSADLRFIRNRRWPERYVRLAGEAGSRVEVDPSHRVALRPNTRYVLSGRVRTEGNASLNVEVGLRRLASPADFLAGISWTTANLQPARASVRAAGTPSEIVPVGLAARDRAYLWLFDTAASWKNIAQTVPAPVRRADLVVEGLDDDLYRVRWWHTREGRTLAETSLRSEAGRLRLSVPDFQRDIACRIEAD